MRKYREKQNNGPRALLPQSKVLQRGPVVVPVQQKRWRQTMVPVQTAASLAPAAAASAAAPPILLNPSPLSCPWVLQLVTRCTLAPAGNGKKGMKNACSVNSTVHRWIDCSSLCPCNGSVRNSVPSVIHCHVVESSWPTG